MLQLYDNDDNDDDNNNGGGDDENDDEYDDENDDDDDDDDDDDENDDYDISISVPCLWSLPFNENTMYRLLTSWSIDSIGDCFHWRERMLQYTSMS